MDGGACRTLQGIQKRFSSLLGCSTISFPGPFPCPGNEVGCSSSREAQWDLSLYQLNFNFIWELVTLRRKEKKNNKAKPTKQNFRISFNNFGRAPTSVSPEIIGLRIWNFCSYKCIKMKSLLARNLLHYRYGSVYMQSYVLKKWCSSRIDYPVNKC